MPPPAAPAPRLTHRNAQTVVCCWLAAGWPLLTMVDLLLFSAAVLCCCSLLLFSMEPHVPPPAPRFPHFIFALFPPHHICASVSSDFSSVDLPDPSPPPQRWQLAVRRSGRGHRDRSWPEAPGEPAAEGAADHHVSLQQQLFSLPFISLPFIRWRNCRDHRLPSSLSWHCCCDHRLSSSFTAFCRGTTVATAARSTGGRSGATWRRSWTAGDGMDVSRQQYHDKRR